MGLSNVKKGFRQEVMSELSFERIPLLLWTYYSLNKVVSECIHIWEIELPTLTSKMQQVG